MEPFNQLQSHYAQQIASMKIEPDRIKELDQDCEILLKEKAAFVELSDRTPNRTPAAFIMAVAMREMSGNTRCFLGNGQALSRRTTITPKGLGPWLQPYPENFIQGGLLALHIDGIDKITQWSLPRAAYESEALNGFGYMSKGIPSPYVFGGTNIQRKGKYVSDGNYDPNTMDTQLGTLTIIERLFDLDASLKFGDVIAKVEDAPPLVPVVPVGIGGGINVFLLQQRLNVKRVSGTPLQVDGNFGRATTRAVKSFQFINHLSVDGLVGPKTIKALQL
jgi:lysozyme family protein